MYPILSKHNKGLALGSVAFGIIAGVFIIIGVIILLLLLTLSHEFAKLERWMYRLFRPWVGC